MILNKSELSKALQKASTTILESSKDSSSFLLFHFEKEELYLKSFQNKIFTTTPLVYSGESSCIDFALNFKRFKKWVQTVGSEEIEIDFNDREKILLAKNDRGTVDFAVLNTETFPSWDFIVEKSKKTGEVQADSLAKAFTYSKNFIYSDENSKPQFATSELKNGVLSSTDLGGLSTIYLEGLEACSFRVHKNNISKMLKWLSYQGSDSIEVWKHEKAFVLKTTDGSLYGEIEISVPYAGPSFSKKDLETTFFIEVTKKDLNYAIKHLWSAANWDQSYLEMTILEDSVELVLDSEAKNKLVTSIDRIASKQDLDLPSTILVSKDYLEKIVRLFPEETLKLGVLKKGNKNGFFVTSHSYNDDEYISIMSWRS